MNEIEARRVRHALDRAAAAAPALTPDELAGVAERARIAPRETRRRRANPAAVLAAAVALGAVAAAGVVTSRGGEPDSQTAAEPTLVPFPEGSALRLLTESADRARPR